MKSIKTFCSARNAILILVLVLSFSLLFSSSVMAEDVLRTRAREGQDIETLDPAFMIGYEEDNIGLAIYSRLVEFDPDNPPELQKDAAKEFEIRDDGQEFYFELKEGIQFHGDYGELTAEDVKFTYERVADPEVEAVYADDFATLDRVEVIDDYSGRIILEEPFPGMTTRTLPLLRGSILSKEAFEEKGPEEFATNPIGSGPYKFESWEPGDVIVLSAHEDYYGEQPDFDRVEIYPIVELEAAEVAFDTGELNETRISLESVERYEAMDDVVVNELELLNFEWIGFNHRHEPFDNEKVRRAVRYAIDVDEIIEGAFHGAAVRADALIGPGVLGHWEDAPAYEQDLEKAEELLEEAGYPDGFDTQIGTYPISTNLNATQIAQYQLMQVGINVDINILEEGQQYEVFSDKDYEGMHYGSFTLNPDPGYWTEWYTEEQVGSWNFMHWVNDEFNELHDKANVTTDEEERAEMYIRMQEIMNEDEVFVPLTYDAGVNVTHDHIDPAYLYHYTLYDEFELEE